MQSYDSSDDEQIGDLVQNKKSTARRSLESQFSAASGKEQPLLCLDIEENVPLRSEVQPSSSTGSSCEGAKFAWRTPSYYAAVTESSSSLLDIDPGWQSSECHMLEDLPRKKSKSRSIATLPSTPRTPIPKQTSTPGSGQPSLAQSDVHISISNDSIPICRICHEGEGHESLLSPCYCTGSVGMLHLSCLERWLGTSNTSRCEICKYEFKVRRIPRSVWDFLRHSKNRTERRNMMCDVVCFVVLTPLTVLSAYLCLSGVGYYSKWDDRWEVPGLICLTVSLLVIFLVWCIIAIRHHTHIVVKWRKHNQVIKVIYLSPVKGKSVLRTSSALDQNENHVRLSSSSARANVSLTRQASHVSCSAFNVPCAASNASASHVSHQAFNASRVASNASHTAFNASHVASNESHTAFNASHVASNASHTASSASHNPLGISRASSASHTAFNASHTASNVSRESHAPFRIRLRRTPSSHASGASYNITVALLPSQSSASSESYRTATLRPILRYSSNRDAYSCASDRGSESSVMHTVSWVSGENSVSLTSPLVSVSNPSSPPSYVGKETYV